VATVAVQIDPSARVPPHDHGGGRACRSTAMRDALVARVPFTIAESRTRGSGGLDWRSRVLCARHCRRLVAGCSV